VNAAIVTTLARVAAERVRQDERHGRPHERGYSDETWLRVLVEEVGEVARAINDGDGAGLKLELVQVAAVAAAFLEAID
jgi:NTP pyrophosphatase (non-canonical NTP hydrolase)